MVTDGQLIKIYREAYNLLLHEVGERVLSTELNHYTQYKPTNLRDVFRGMMFSLKNKQGYQNFIGDPDDMKEIFMDFDPRKVDEKYGNDWIQLATLFRDKYGSKYKIQITNKRNAWVMYSKGVLSCARFIARFTSLDDFDTFVQSFFYNEYTVAALPMILDKEIYGFGFALACDFLKEQGYTKYAKPDIHLQDIFTGLDIVDDESQYEVFKQAVRIAKLVGVEPVIVDKVFWLIGSGNFNSQDITIPSQKKNFITLCKKRINIKE